MDIGNKIKKYRERMNLSQEELALKLYVSRQTISNWETNKCCPDIESIIMLSNIFSISLDELIKEDLIEMKKIIEEKEKKKFDKLSVIFTIEFITIIICSYPLLKFLKIWGMVIWIILFSITMITALKIEKVKKQYDIQTYKEILAFCSNTTLSRDDKNKELGKRPYQKIFLALGSGLITLLMMTIFHLLFSS